MRECTIISKLSFLFFVLLACSGLNAFAQMPSGETVPSVAAPGGPKDPGASVGVGGGGDPNAPAIPTGKQKEDTGLFDQASPYLNYGDFDITEEENQDALYFQYGRFFGVSLGVGYETALGDRGKLYQAAIPRIDLRLHYWFDFNFAMDLGVFFATHSFNYTTSANGNTAAQTLNYQDKIIGYGIHLKYYFDTTDSSAALSFANPFVEVGFGEMSKAETNQTSNGPDNESTPTVDFGGGLEFPIVNKKTYFILEALYHTQNFDDSTSSKFANVTPDLTGGFFTLIGHFMFVW
jgi:hypothetical protein